VTTPGAYSAGSIFLQVIPSYRDLMRSLGRDAKDIEKALRGELEKAMESGPGMDSPLSTPKSKAKRKKQAAEAGQEEAEEYAGRFRETLQRSLKKTAKELKALKVNLDSEDLENDLRSLEERVEALLDVEIDADMDASEILAEMVAIEEGLERISEQSIDIEIKTNAATAAKDIAGLRAVVEAVTGQVYKLKVEADTDESKVVLGAFERDAKAAIKKAQEALQGTNFSTASGAQDGADLLERLDRLQTVKIGVDITTVDFLAEMALLEARLELLENDPVEIEARFNSARARAQIAAFRATVNGADSDDINVDADVDSSKFNNFKGALGDAANNLRGFNALILAGAAAGPILVPVLAALAGGALAAGAAFAGAGAGLGALILGFSGISDAVKAINEVERNAAKDARASAKAVRAAANGVRDATRGVEDARRNAARAAEDAAERVDNAIEQQRRAEESLIDAQTDAVRAQQRLNRAREDAQNQLEDMALRARGGALAERQALIDLFEAEVAYRSAQADPGATNLEREQASINLERERLNIEQVRLENGRLAEEQVEVARTGVEGTSQVIEAREGLVAANGRVVDAERGVAEANRDVSQAREDQARVAADSGRAIEDAQLRLTDAQVAYQEALTQTSASQDKLKEELSQLGPAGQAFAFFIAGLKDEFFAMRDAVQAGLLPGVQQAIEMLLPFMPQIISFLTVMGETLGALFVEFARFLTTNPAMLAFFQMIERYAPIFTTLFARGLMELIELFAILAVTFAPLAEDIVSGLVGLLDAFNAFLQSPEGQQMLQDFIAYLREVGPEIGEMLLALVGALINLGRALAPYAGALLNAITAILEFIAGMDPDTLGAIVVGVLLAVSAFQILAGVFGVLGIVGQLVITIASIIGFVIGATTITVLAWIVAIVAVVAVLAVLYFKVEWVRNFIDAAFRLIWEVIKMAFEGIMWAWENILSPVLDAWWRYMEFLVEVIQTVLSIVVAVFKKIFEEIQAAWDRFANSGFGIVALAFFSQIWDGIANAARAAWETIVDIFKGGVRLVISIVNEGIIDPINSVAEKVGADERIRRIADPFAESTSRPTAGGGRHQEFATGGWTGPGTTYEPAGIVHADEFVIKKASQRKMRDLFPGLLDFINEHGTLPGFAAGGLVDFGRLLQSRGFRVSEHPSFGGVRGRHAKNSQHYRNNAIDVNYGPGGQSAVEMAAIDEIIGLAKDYGLRTIWRTTGHFNHAHFDGGGGQSILGRIGNAVGSAVSNVAGVFAKPMQFIKDKVLGFPGVEGLRNSSVGRILLGGLSNIMEHSVGWIRDKAGPIGDFFLPEGDDAKPDLYDRGGWLPPGLSSVVNATGRPEAILTGDQWEMIEANLSAGGGGDTYHVPVTQQNDPEAVADAIRFSQRHARRGGVYASRRG
jgi:hypothetical protein